MIHQQQKHRACISASFTFPFLPPSPLSNLKFSLGPHIVFQLNCLLNEETLPILLIQPKGLLVLLTIPAFISLHTSFYTLLFPSKFVLNTWPAASAFVCDVWTTLSTQNHRAASTLNLKIKESTRWNLTQAHGPYLQNNLLVNGKLGNDVCQEQVATVLAGWVHAGLGQEAGPGKGHQAPQFAVPVLVVVVDVMGGMLHQQRGKLQEIDPQRIQHISLFFWIKYLVPGMIKEERMKLTKKERQLLLL